jgi:ABC-2 type transport system ATP-binding protein
LSELAELCDSIAIIEKGELIVSGALENIRAQAQGTRILHIHLLTDPSEAKSTLQMQPGVGQIQLLNSDSKSLEVEFSGDMDETANLLEVLIAQGVRITSFNEAQTDLEDLFLRLTKGEVA